MEIFLVLNEDGTGVGSFFSDTNITWDTNSLQFKDLGMNCMVTYTGTELTLVIDFDANTRYVFVRGEGAAPEVDLYVEAE